MRRGKSPWWRLLGSLGHSGLEGAEHETRSYLARRVALYLRVLWVIFLIRYMGVVLLGAIRGNLLEELTARPRLAHLGAILFSVLCEQVARRAKLRTHALGVLDLLGTVGAGVFQATALAFLPPGQRTVDLAMVLVLTQTLVARAAIVPSAARRTLGIGSINLGMLAAASYAAGTTSQVTGGMPAWMWVYRTIEWGGISVLLTGVISFVIYGLRRRVEQAVRLGQYTLLEKIGEGGMGIVYRASHGMLRRPTAIKLLPPERAGARAIQRFEREVQTTATLVHPNTVAIFDFGRTPEGVFYYAMEYLDGIDLDQLVKFDGPQNVGRVVHILKQMCAALAEAHGRGLVHRDMKPANVVLCEYGGHPDFVKVVDFGLVKDLAPPEQSGASMIETFVGTPLYLAPEAVIAAQVDERSDIYAVGAIAYFLLTGQPVFHGATTIEIVGHHLHSKVVPPSQHVRDGLPSELDELVLACLEKDPARRPARADVLLAALEALKSVPPWSPSDARAWWARQGAAARRARRHEGPLEGSVTVGIDPSSRSHAPN